MSQVSEIAPITHINQYLFSHADITAILGNTDFDDAPIYPYTEPREAQVPFLIYNFRRNTDATTWWQQTEDITYQIFDTDFDRLNKLINTMANLLARMDDSAKELNEWLRLNGGSDYKFEYVRLNGVLAADGFEQEGGRASQIVFFRVGYVPRLGIGLE